ncbi:MAG: sugar transferase [Deltaproteobacteria bacterium]|nr:MAG: sugar transferase [Deltaproteobacteria bacterium]
MSRSVYRRDGGWRLRWAILVAGDLLAACLAYLLAFVLRTHVPLPLTQGYLPGVRFAEVHHHWPEMLLAQAAVLYFLGLYEAHALTRPRDHVGAMVAAAPLQALVLVAVYFFRQDLMFPRSIFVVLAALDATLLVAWRLGSRPLLGSYPRRRVVVVGTNATAAEVIGTIRAQHWLGMDIVGAVAGDGARAAALGDVPVLGGREELPALCQRHEVDEVIIASDHVWQDQLLDALSQSEGARARICVVPSPYEILIGRTEHLRLHDIPLIEVIREPAGGASVVKRAFDAVVAAVLFLATLPVMALVALAIRLTSHGPVLFFQERVGKDRRSFTMVKFRTMQVDAERKTGPVLASENDPRITWLGRYLRALRLDELPQLWNVLCGDMSFVGPRPERPEFVRGFERDIKGYAERFKLRPGLTGYAQVNGEYHTSPATKLKYDLAYIYNRSLWLDVRILADTVKVMLTRRGV